MVAKHFRCRAGAAATTVQDDIVSTGIQGKLNVLFYVVCAELESYGYTTGDLSYLVSKPFEVIGARQITEGRWGDGRLAFGDSSDL